MLPAELPKWVHRKRAKGLTYLYFDTGQRDPKGKRVFVRLPDFADPAFYRAYSGLRDRRENRAAATPNILMVPALCEAFRKSWTQRRKRPLAKATMESYETYLRVIEAELDTFPAAEVEPTDVAALHQKLSDRPGAANQCVRTLSAMYAWAKKPTVRLVAHNPAEAIELFEGGEHQPWPEELLTAALAAKDRRIRLVVALLYYTGQRIGDVLAMRWTDIRGGFLSVRQEKTDDELTVRLHSGLAAVLDGMPRGLTTIVAKPDGTAYTKSAVRDWIKTWAAGRGCDVVPHGLRKNAVNALLEAECTPAQVNAITGQSMQMIEHYAKKRDRKKLSESAVLRWENGGRT